MNGEKDVGESIKELERLCAPEQPYSGETRIPETSLDHFILGLITTYGNDNIPEHDAYMPPNLRKPQISPSAMTQDELHRYVFGENYMTTHIDISDTVKLLAVYGKERQSYFVPQIVIDVLEPQGGLVKRTEFRNDPSSVGVVIKTHITDFRANRYPGQIFQWPDFSRELSDEEEKVLYQVLDPDDSLRGIGWLTSVSEAEQRLTDANTAEAEKNKDDLEKSLKSVADARRHAEQSLRDVVIY